MNDNRWRRSETISIATLLTLAGWIWWASSKASAWDQTTQIVSQVIPTIEDHSKQLAVITSDLSDIKEDLRYLRRHAKP